MTEFLNKYHTFTAIVPYDKDRSERAFNLERSFHLLSDVYRTFDVLMKKVFIPDADDSEEVEDADDGDGKRRSAGKLKKCVSPLLRAFLSGGSLKEFPYSGASVVPPGVMPRLQTPDSDLLTTLVHLQAREVEPGQAVGGYSAPLHMAALPHRTRCVAGHLAVRETVRAFRANISKCSWPACSSLAVPRGVVSFARPVPLLFARFPSRLNDVYRFILSVAGAVIANASDLVMSVHLAIACVHLVASMVPDNILRQDYGMLAGSLARVVLCLTVA